MVWGCIHSTGMVFFFTNVEERLNEDAYIDLLGNYMIPSVHLLSLPRMDQSFNRIMHL